MRLDLRRHARPSRCPPWTPSPPPGTSWSPWSPGRTRRPAGAASWCGRRSAPGPTSAASRCSPRPRPREPEFLDRLRELGPGLRAGGRLRRAGAAGGAGDPRARLGQPALLAAARLARRRAGAARGAARRRGHRRQRLRAGGGAGHRPGLRHPDRGRSGPPTPPATCWTGSPPTGAGLLVAVLDAIEAGTARAHPQPADGVSLAPKITVEDAADPLGRPGVRGGPPDPRLHARARRVDDAARRAAQAGPGPAASPTRPRLKPGRAAGRTHPGAGRHRDHAGDARRGPRGRQEADARHRLGARPAHPAGGAVRVTRRAPGRATDAHGPTGRTAPAGRPPGGPGYGGRDDRDDRSGRAPRAGRPPSDPARQAAYEAIAAVHRDDAYANLVLPEILRDMRLHGRDAAFATELTYGTLRALGHPRPDHRRGRRPRGGPDRPAGPRRPAARRLPAAAHPGARRTPRSTDRRPGAGGRAGRGRLRQRGDARRSPRTATWTPGWPSWRPAYDEDPVGNLVGAAQPSAVDHPGVRRGARRRPGGHRAGC